ncbi:MAG: AraC family transcriptional regulator [Clostridia bacterium]|nr:AraC family transcriptional regulator [Clostridia bacterium]
MKDIYIMEDYATSDEVPMNYKLTEGYDTQLHGHEFVEIFYVISGNAPHKFDNEPTKTLQAGDTYLIMPTHYHEFLKRKQDCTHRDIMIRENLFKEACNFIDPKLYNNFVSGAMPYYVTLSPTQINRLEQKINTISQMLPTQIGQRTAITRAFAVELIETFVFHKHTAIAKEIPAWFRQLLTNFNTVYYLQQGLQKITGEFNYDKKYMCRVFKKYMGMTMTEYLNHTRLDYALTMIQGSNKSILDIAQNLGFSSVSYFNVIFKKRYGITPLEARKR